MVVVTIVVVGTSDPSISPLSQTSTDAIWFSMGTFIFLWSIAAKNCQVDASTSALLASLVPCRDLGTVDSLGIVSTCVLGNSI